MVVAVNFPGAGSQGATGRDPVEHLDALGAGLADDFVDRIAGQGVGFCVSVAGLL